MCFFFSSRRRHTRFDCDWSSDVCSSDLSAWGNKNRVLKTDSINSPIIFGLGGATQRHQVGYPAGGYWGTAYTYKDLRSEEHTSELQSQSNLVCRLLLEKKKNKSINLSGQITMDS